MQGMVLKRKRVSKAKAEAKKQLKAVDDVDVKSDDEDSDLELAPPPAEEEDDEFFETPDEKRVRLAKEYLGKLEETHDQAGVKDQIAHDVEKDAGRVRFQVEDLKLGEARFNKGHKLPATCLCMSSDERTVYTGGKDCALLRWDVETGSKDVFHNGGRNRFECGGHFGQVLGVSLSEQRNLLVSAGVDRVVRLWDARAPPRSACVGQMLGHNGAVTAVVMDPDGNTCYTASADKSLRIWDLGKRREVGVLLGHVSGASTMDLACKGRPLTGGGDKTVRLWKTDKDTHLMFSKHTYPVDAVAAVDSERFISGSQDGNIYLWSHASKKPLASALLKEGGWISALAAVRRGNMAFTGSVDGVLRCWRFGRGGKNEDGTEKKGVRLEQQAASAEAPGCINAIAVGKKVVACAVGKELKNGRWFHEKSRRNGLLIVPLSYRENEEAAKKEK